MDIHGTEVPYGKHKGMLWTRMLVKDLQYMVNSGHPLGMVAGVELARRGVTDRSELYVSGHAIDKASLRLLGNWTASGLPGEGLYSWLYRVGVTAYKHGQVVGDNDEARLYDGIKFVYKFGEVIPTLKTVMIPGERN